HLPLPRHGHHAVHRRLLSRHARHGRIGGSMRAICVCLVVLASVSIFGARKTTHVNRFWPDGHLRLSASYRDGVLDGEYRTWRSNGHAYELRHFARGRESGAQRSWNDDGTLFLNYDVRDGRRYGFVNAELCAPNSAGVQDRSFAPAPIRAGTSPLPYYGTAD